MGGRPTRCARSSTSRRPTSGCSSTEPVRRSAEPSTPTSRRRNPDPMSDGELPHVTCKEFVELVTAYLDGALPVDLVASIDAHLEVCPGCVTVIEQWRTVIALAGELQEDD